MTPAVASSRLSLFDSFLASLSEQQKLFVEEGWLGNCSRGLPACDSYDSEDGDFGQGRARDKYAVGVGIKVGRRDLYSVVQKRKKIVGNDTLQGLAIEEAQPKPQTVEFGAAEEGAALRLEIIIEIADEVDRANARERELLMLTILGEEIERIELAQARGIKVAAEGFAVVELDNHLFVGAGWGAKFQRTRFSPSRTRICAE
jgi:hypothetical protein